MKTLPSLERSQNQTPVISGYTLLLYCCKCNGEKWPDSRNGLIDEIATDGKSCYSIARKIARKKGWVLHKDGYATCKKCKN